MGKLTKRSIEALAPREIDYIAWDSDVFSFGVRVMPSGRKSFVLQYRAGRRSRRMVLGYVNVVTPEQARAMAIQHLAALRQGVDPLAERDTAVAAGQGLPMIGKLLGHTQVATTARYAHLAADPVKAAADHVSAPIAASVLG
jgi:integrase